MDNSLVPMRFLHEETIVPVLILVVMDNSLVHCAELSKA